MSLQEPFFNLIIVCNECFVDVKMTEIKLSLKKLTEIKLSLNQLGFKVNIDKVCILIYINKLLMNEQHTNISSPDVSDKHSKSG